MMPRGLDHDGARATGRCSPAPTPTVVTVVGSEMHFRRALDNMLKDRMWSERSTKVGKLEGWLCHLMGCLQWEKPDLGRRASFPAAQTVKNMPAIQETWVCCLGEEDLLAKGMATHSSILAWRIPWTEEPGGLWSTGSQKNWTQLSD